MSIDDPGPAGLIFQTIVQPISAADVPEIVVYSLILLLCLIVSAICSSSENAFFSHRDSDTEALREEKSKTAKYILEVLERPKQLLATMLLLNSLVNVAFVLIAESAESAARSARSAELAESAESAITKKIEKWFINHIKELETYE